MGQYYVVANFSKKEFLNPHRLGTGGKLAEMFYSDWFSKVLLAAIALGDWTLPDHPFVGRWAGDQVILVGDYMTSDYVSQMIEEGKLSLPSWVLEELTEHENAVVDENPSFYSYVKTCFKDISVEAIKFLYRVEPEVGLGLAVKFLAISPENAFELLKDREIKKALQQALGKDFQRILSRIKRLSRR
jgi:hypothetical protein